MACWDWIINLTMLRSIYHWIGSLLLNLAILPVSMETGVDSESVTPSRYIVHFVFIAKGGTILFPLFYILKIVLKILQEKRLTPSLKRHLENLPKRFF